MSKQLIIIRYRCTSHSVSSDLAPWSSLCSPHHFSTKIVRESTLPATVVISMRLFCPVTCTLSLAILSVAEPHCTHDIPTKQGFIRGHDAPKKSSVCEYLGIPYAAPPTGDLRFAPPRHPEHTELYIAVNPGVDCPQTTSSIFAYPNATAQYKQIITNFANS